MGERGVARVKHVGLGGKILEGAEGGWEFVMALVVEFSGTG